MCRHQGGQPEGHPGPLLQPVALQAAAEVPAARAGGAQQGGDPRLRPPGTGGPGTPRGPGRGGQRPGQGQRQGRRSAAGGGRQVQVSGLFIFVDIYIKGASCADHSL